ncbi:MAG TPA: thermonuclease family protein, partial [Microthrixaceae bacterium]|nr:thermonuclease family protein [Microthrixaceae bacterium]
MEQTPSSACAAVADSEPEQSSSGSDLIHPPLIAGPTTGPTTGPRVGRNRLKRVSVLAALAVGTGAAIVGLGSCSNSGGDASTYALEPNATVIRVVDGDTIVVDSNGEQERVRLIGINTPESVDPSRPVMCFGKEASAHMAELLKVGTKVQLKRDVEPRDRYKRLLAYVYRATDGLFINLEMVRDGYANQYRFPPNVTHEKQFSQAASTARHNGSGLWSACEKPFEE